MAWFSYQCPDHGKFTISLLKREKTFLCPNCNQVSHAIIKLGSSQIVEKLDNGIMARSVERIHNIEEIMAERADKFSEKEETENHND